MSNVRIWVRPGPGKRVASWVVHCDGCEVDTVPARRKSTAETIAGVHAEQAHQGKAIVAVKKPQRR